MSNSAYDFLKDVQTVNIIIKQIGPNKSIPTFKRIVERCSRTNVIQVSDNPRRVFRCSFVSATNCTEFSELQLHRRVYAVVGVAFTADFVKSVQQPTNLKSSRESVDSAQTEEEEITRSYEKLKQQYSSIFDSRCIIIGANQDDYGGIKHQERICYPSMDEAIELEKAIRDLMNAIYIVIEMKRVDVAFERNQSVHCPSLPNESRWQVGVENKASKTYKKKCLGRCRKQHADFCLLTGLPQLAVEAYDAAIENLKAAQDHLWLAAAYDGWASSVCIMHAEQLGEMNFGAFQRVASMHSMFNIPAVESCHVLQSRGADSLCVSNDNTATSPNGHKRHHSDEHVRTGSSLSNGTHNESFGNESGIVSNGSSPSLKDEVPKPKKVLNPIASLLGEKSREKKTKEEIIGTFKNAVEEYSKFTFAGWLEYETVMRAIVYLILERDYIALEQFHRDYTGKYLDDLNTFMDHHMKAQICLNSATMYKEIGFLRKQAFYARLSVLFELHITDGRQRTATDYKNVYPVLFKTLDGYGISLGSMHDLHDKKLGPEKLQIKCLHEIFTAANRAGHRDAAIRHLCFLLQVYFPYLEPTMATRLFDDLDNLVKQSPTVHHLNHSLSIEDGKILIPPLQLTRFPIIQNPKVVSLPTHFAPKIVSHSQSSIFIYTPRFSDKSDTLLWVADCPCEVEVIVRNLCAKELVMRDLCLLADGVRFEPVQARLILPPSDPNNDHDGAVIRLLGYPREEGDLFITGYSCNVFGLINICKFQSSNQKPNRIRVRVLPKLAEVRMESTLPRAPIGENDDEPSAEARVFSGQRIDHTITIYNDSDIPVKFCEIRFEQPLVQGGPPLISLDSVDLDSNLFIKNDESQDNICFPLAPRESRIVKFHIFGIDPTATAHDLSDNEKVLESVVPLASTQAIPNPDLEPTDMDTIPYTGRLLTCEFAVRYHSDIENVGHEVYERKRTLPIAVAIIPAVTVSAWHVLPGDTPFSRYIVVDVTNSTDHDAELVYSGNRRMNVLPKETCRVPILCPCCSDIACGAFYQAQQKGSSMMQKIETERLRQILERHVARHFDIRWSIPTLKLEGHVPIGSLLSSVSLLKQLVLPAISLDFIINGNPYMSEDDISVGIGQAVTVKVLIISSQPDPFKGILSLDCEQEISHQLGSSNASHYIILAGAKKTPFLVEKNEDIQKYSVDFELIFLVEGSFRVRPQITPAPGQNPLLPEEMFATPIAFSVTTKF
ncbi:unnamed protein product [Caenorhabditis bovis]|uniref:Uncharacterized protein n=1 Tax=Caenorhabditis bovis TaxID=2654633 RepID=A0A8S1FEB9_9PELO|nr:unnamed protein product [Caenorhabditis bovis]